jgi:hypothetical protein
MADRIALMLILALLITGISLPVYYSTKALETAQERAQ